MSFRDAMTAETNAAHTINGMRTLVSSLDPNVDLFFQIGASRGKDISEVFAAAHLNSRELALRTLLWVRDIRGGAGERDTFRKLLLWLEDNAPADAARLIPKIPDVGRWDDLLVFKTDALRERAFYAIARAIVIDRNALAAKWMPRKGPDANALRRFLRLSPKTYRKVLVEVTGNIVETQMASRRWDEIEFGKLPSLAAARYQKAFKRRCAVRYAAYKEALKSGTAKVNAGAIYPYDVIKALRHGDEIVAEAQWNAMPNWLDDATGIFPIVDVSGSMDQPVPGSKLNVMDVAISLGLYVADKQSGPFSNLCLTFSRDPTFIDLTPVPAADAVGGQRSLTLREKEEAIRGADWGANTNLEAAFRMILDVALGHKLPPEDMPGILLILSDIEFDAATSGKDTALDMIDALYNAAGYTRPTVVFWNLSARPGNTPVRYDEAGTALVSGFSPAIMTAILGGDTTPQSAMMAAIMADRYEID